MQMEWQTVSTMIRLEQCDLDLHYLLRAVSKLWIISDILIWMYFCSTSHTHEPWHDKTCLREFSTRPDRNWPAQPQKLARVLKFRLYNLEILYYLSRCWSDCGCAGWSAPLLFAYDIGHIFSWPGSYVYAETVEEFHFHLFQEIHFFL